MTIETDHPELASEQAYVDRAYRCMADMLADVSSFGSHGRNDFEREAFEAWKSARIAALSDTKSALVFGRIDEAAADTFYIGRHHVREPDYETVVVDWRAPVARAFYQASVRDAMGLSRRRQFLVDGREVLGITDEDLISGGDDNLRAAEILEEELRRTRGGRMRDIVATIQAEQDKIIRSPLDGIVVVQGGPGTGKTAIGLHRAAFLLYEHRRLLQRQGVLVLGPSSVFITYISQVLPSLGESAVTQVAVDDLAPSVRVTAIDDPAARLKGDARMAALLRRALDGRSSPASSDLELALHGTRFTVGAAEIDEAAADIRSRGVPHRKGRELLRDELLLRCWRAYTGAMPAEAVAMPYAEAMSVLRKGAAFRSALDRVWPSLSAVALVRDLLRSPSKLAQASEGLLSAQEQRLLLRRGTAWSAADRQLLDEARDLVEGPPDRYGHVIADEAQDLSPMQLRMIARRCPSASMTFLGDLGQATGAWAHDAWDEVLEHLPGRDGARVEELTLGYRVGAAIMEFAAPILSRTMPGLRAPGSVRRERGDVHVRSSPSDALAGRVAAEASEVASSGGAVAVIVPVSLAAHVREAMRKGGLRFGDADTEGLTQQVTVVPAARCKGLEFDGVVLVEPARIAEEGGLRLLYVAATRAMRTLVVLHSEPLPECLEQRSPLSA